MTEQRPVSWRTLPAGLPVLAHDGTRLGTTVEAVGSDADDIFHGIRFRAEGADGDLVVPARAVTELTPDHVATSLASGDVAGLERYDPTATYRVDWKHTPGGGRTAAS